MERLYEETNKLKLKFASLMFNVENDLEKKLSVEQIVNILVYYEKDFDDILTECSSFAKVFRKVSHFVSFFDYELLEHLTDEHGSDAIKEEMETYIGYFREFSKRRVTECPSNAFADRDHSESSEQVLVVVADRIIEKLTVDELKRFNRRVSKILGDKLVRVLFVQGGSIYLTFLMIEDRNFTITGEQCEALQREGVTSVTHGDHCFNTGTAIRGTYS